MRNLTTGTQTWDPTGALACRIIGLRPHGLGEGGPDRSAQTAVRSSTPGTSPSPPHWKLPGVGSAPPVRFQLGGSGSGAPATPLSWTLILGPRKPPKSGRKRPNFSGFLGSCGATPRGGGGAPPTTLILLRNQRQTAERREQRSRRTAGTVPGVAPPPARPIWQPIQAKMRDFRFLLLLAVGVERGLSEAGCRSVPAGRCPSACRRGLQASTHLRGSPTEGGRRLSEPAYPGRGVPLATHPLRSA